jgi:hypothetical protein
MGINLIDKIVPKNNAFVGMVDADQVITSSISATTLPAPVLLTVDPVTNLIASRTAAEVLSDIGDGYSGYSGYVPVSNGTGLVNSEIRYDAAGNLTVQAPQQVILAGTGESGVVVFQDGAHMLHTVQACIWMTQIHIG